MPVSLPAVQATAPPAASAPMPSVTISGCTRQRWQIQPVSAPSTPAITTTAAIASTGDQWWVPYSSETTIAPITMWPGTLKSMPPRTSTSVWPSAARPSSEASTSIESTLVSVEKPSIVAAP